MVLPKDQASVDCLIAEVKEPSVEFNEPIRKPDGVRLIADALRMFGVFPRASLEAGCSAYCMATDLHREINKGAWPDIP